MYAMLPLNFTPFPELKTERLLLRQLKETDANAIFLIRSNEAVNKYIDRPKTSTIEEASLFIQKINDGFQQHNLLYWAICLKPSNTLIGTICLWNIETENQVAEIGYELNPAFWKSAFMQEAITKIIDFCFSKMNLSLIKAVTRKDNVDSIRLLQKNNFIYNEVQLPYQPELKDYLLFYLANTAQTK